MDLAVVRLGRAAQHQGVDGPGRVVALLEHAGQDRRAALGRHLGRLGGERAVERLGRGAEVGARLAEVAGERLGEHHEVAALRRELREPGPVRRRVEGRCLLHQGHLHPPSVDPGGDPGGRPVRQARLLGWTSTPWCWPAVGPSGSTARTRPPWTWPVRPCSTAPCARSPGARTVVVVGDERPTDVPVVWTREQPGVRRPGRGGVRRSWTPCAGVLPCTWPVPGPGAADMHGTTPLIVVLAVDMPAVTAATVGRLVAAADGRDGAVLVDGGRPHLAMARDGGGARRRTARPGRGRGDAWALGGARPGGRPGPRGGGRRRRLVGRPAEWPKCLRVSTGFARLDP